MDEHDELRCDIIMSKNLFCSSATTETPTRVQIQLSFIRLNIKNPQNCVYNVPSDFQSIHRGHNHLFFLIQKHLGPDYQCAITSSTTNETREKTSLNVEENKNKMDSGLRTTHTILMVKTDAYPKVR